MSGLSRGLWGLFWSSVVCVFTRWNMLEQSATTGSAATAAADVANLWERVAADACTQSCNATVPACVHTRPRTWVANDVDSLLMESGTCGVSPPPSSANTWPANHDSHSSRCDASHTASCGGVAGHLHVPSSNRAPRSSRLRPFRTPHRQLQKPRLLAALELCHWR